MRKASKKTRLAFQKGAQRILEALKEMPEGCVWIITWSLILIMGVVSWLLRVCE
jgi:hypothetical protein